MPRQRFWLLWGGLSELCYLALALLSPSFAEGTDARGRPLPALLVLLGLASTLYLAAMTALHRGIFPRTAEVVALSLLFRLTLLPSHPIQEDDVYRYLWDGKLVAAGLDPFRRSPFEVERQEEAAAEREVRERSDSNRAIFRSLNHPRHRTVYPAPVQLCFGLVCLLVPASWPVYSQVVAMKVMVLLFDGAALLVLLRVLAAAGLPAGWAAVYGFCPLLVKEFANSGHMDAIPTCLLALGLWAAARGRPFLAGLGLGASAAAKYLALAVLPVAARCLARQPRARAVLLIAAGALLPLLGSELPWAGSAALRGRSLLTFLEEWEMNDLLFGWGVRALEALGLGERAAARGALAAAGAALAAVVVHQLREPPPAGDGARAARHLLSRAFSVLGALLLLSPVAFPWYFAPLVLLLPFARMRAWLLLPAFLMVYYLRFWYLYHLPGPHAGFARGTDFFDEVLVPLEFGAFFAVWAGEWFWRRSWRGRTEAPGAS